MVTGLKMGYVMGRYMKMYGCGGVGVQLFGKVRFLLIHTKTDDLEDSEVVVSEYFLRIFCLNRMHAIF